MSPRKIVSEALRHGIDLIAVTDHNTVANVPAVAGAAKDAPLVVLPGAEVCTKEEVHVLAIFDSMESAYALQSIVFDRLAGKNDPDAFGLQVIANEEDEVEGFEDRLLIGAADISIDEAVAAIHRLGGMAIAAHVDRESYGIIGQLGFIPAGLKFDALEISAAACDPERATGVEELRDRMFIRNSDAHSLSQIGSQTTQYWLEEPTFGELKKALAGADGRSIGLQCPDPKDRRQDKSE